MLEKYDDKILCDKSIFEFTGITCECRVGDVYKSEDDKSYVFYLFPKDKILHYAYKAEKGLGSSKHKGINKYMEVLPDLLAIKNNKPKSVKSFIEKHGFFLPLDPTKSNVIEADPLFELINRLRATVFLMEAIVEEKSNYEKILALTLSLLLSPQTSIQLQNKQEQFFTCQHDMGQIWNNTYQPNKKIKDLKPNDEWEFVNSTKNIETDIIPLAEDHPNYHIMKNSLNLPTDQMLNSEEYIPDSIRSQNIWLDINEYFYAVDYLLAYPTSVRAKSTILFHDAINVESYCRLAIDFLYNFCKDVGDIETWSYEGKLFLSDNSQSVSSLLRTKLDVQMREGLFKLAKYTLKTEIENNLRVGVIPSYDIETMTPTWHINNLLSGLYLSIFYMQPNTILYRPCQNPNCGHYFLVSTTAVKNKYCSNACSNAMQQRKYRLRQQLKEKEQINE